MLSRAAAATAVGAITGTIVSYVLLVHTSMRVEAYNVRESLRTIFALKFRHGLWFHVAQHVIVQLRTEKETLAALDASKLAGMDTMLKGMSLNLGCIAEHFAADAALVFRIAVCVFY